MPKTRLISPGSIPNHRLLKNLTTNVNYISYDGTDAGMLLASNNAPLFVPTTKTNSIVFDYTAYFAETINLGSGEASGSDTHYGIYYTQTQTDIAGWNNVYMMYLYSNPPSTTNIFSIDDRVQLKIDINSKKGEVRLIKQGLGFYIRLQIFLLCVTMQVMILGTYNIK